MQLFQEAFNRGDVEALISLYEPNGILIVAGRQIEGHENITAAFQSMVSGGSQMRIVTHSIIESRDGLAVPHGEWTVERTAGSGAPRATQGLSTEVVRRQPDGTWLFVIDNPYTPSHEYSFQQSPSS